MTWEGAKTLGKDRGMEMIGGCPLQNFCDGKKCVILTPTQKDRKMVEEKLTLLREELKQLG